MARGRTLLDAVNAKRYHAATLGDVTGSDKLATNSDAKVDFRIVAARDDLEF